MQNSIGGAEFKTLGPLASIRLKTKISGVPAGAVGCRIQDPGTRGYRWWKSADFSHSAGTAHGAPPNTTFNALGSFQLLGTDCVALSWLTSFPPKPKLPIHYRGRGNFAWGQLRRGKLHQGKSLSHPQF